MDKILCSLITVCSPFPFLEITLIFKNISALMLSIVVRTLSFLFGNRRNLGVLQSHG